MIRTRFRYVSTDPAMAFVVDGKVRRALSGQWYQGHPGHPTLPDRVRRTDRGGERRSQEVPAFTCIYSTRREWSLGQIGHGPCSATVNEQQLLEL